MWGASGGATQQESSARRVGWLGRKAAWARRSKKAAVAPVPPPPVEPAEERTAQDVRRQVLAATHIAASFRGRTARRKYLGTTIWDVDQRGGRCPSCGKFFHFEVRLPAQALRGAVRGGRHSRSRLRRARRDLA
jgi:hypothetical protein